MAMKDRLRRLKAGVATRKKTKRPDAARGKTTKRGAIRKIVESINKRPKLVGMPDMSPGKLRAMTGKTSMKTVTPKTERGFMSKGMSPERAKNITRRATSAGMGAGRGALDSAVNKLVKTIKPDGKPTTLDFKRAAAMIRKSMKDM
tara:strand:+ start:155 stop:592 length:438 start_codon:yes stop_codon:yes gene_type:complete